MVSLTGDVKAAIVALVLLMCLMFGAVWQICDYCIGIYIRPAMLRQATPLDIAAALSLTVSASAACVLVHELGHALVACSLLSYVSVRICAKSTMVQPYSVLRREPSPLERAAILLAGLTCQATLVGIVNGLAAIIESSALAIVACIQAVMLAGYVAVFWLRPGQDGAIVLSIWKERRKHCATVFGASRSLAVRIAVARQQSGDGTGEEPSHAPESRGKQALSTGSEVPDAEGV